MERHAQGDKHSVFIQPYMHHYGIAKRRVTSHTRPSGRAHSIRAFHLLYYSEKQGERETNEL